MMFLNLKFSSGYRRDKAKTDNWGGQKLLHVLEGHWMHRVTLKDLNDQ